jgi:hypothetical protein
LKDLSLPDGIYDDLAKVAEELSLMAKKPISKSMAVDLLIGVYRAHLNNRCMLDMFSQQLQNADLMAPEKFDKYWDEPKRSENNKNSRRTSR